MRILVVLSRVPWPLEKGDKLRAFHLIKELSKRHEIMLFCLTDSRVDEMARMRLMEFCSEVSIYRLSKWRIALQLVKGLFTPLPFQVNYFYSKKAQKAFDSFLEKHVPQHVLCQLIRTTEYVRKYTVLPKSIDYMDAFSTGMKRMAENASWPMSLIMNIEKRRLEKYEREVYALFQNHFIISEQDATHLGVPAKIEVVSNGVDPVFFTQPTAGAKRWDILFTGNMSYRPNVQSSKFLVQEIMPRVWKHRPGVTVCLAGATPSQAVQALKQANVDVTGWVEDIAAVYAQSRVFVAPMLINSGLQNKLLEAMASGLPTVTTDLANNALGATPGKEILIANDADSIAQHILNLLKNPELCETLGTHGRYYIQNNFSWHRSAQLLEQAIVN